MDGRLTFERVGKTFVLHLQRGLAIDVIADASFTVGPYECVVLAGPSGSGKSTILRLAYGNYRADRGRILLSSSNGAVDVAAGEARAIIRARQNIVAYVSQFLSVIPRVATEDLVAVAAEAAAHTAPRQVARDMLARLNLPEPLWRLPPATFSGGEQQRVNIAISIVGRHPVLLIDEPTASLDAENRAVVVDLIKEKRAAGCAILAVFHDRAVRDALATRHLDVTAFGSRGVAA